MAYIQQSGSATTARIPKGKFTAKTESKELAKANGDRVALILTNQGAKDIWLSLGEAATAEEGPCLKAGTGVWENTVYTGAIFAVTKEGESVVTYSEV